MDYRKSEAKSWAREKIKGHWTSMITPFTPDDRIDIEGLKSNIAKVIKLGSIGMTFTWPGGEFWSLTMDERKKICETAVEATRGKIIIGVHTTSSSLNECIELTKHAEETGMDLVNLCPPFMCRSEEQFYEFVKKVAEKVNIGIGLLNSPFTGRQSAQAISKLADIPNVCVVKEANYPSSPALTYEVFSLAGSKIVVSCPYDEAFFYEPFTDFHQQAMYATPQDWFFDTPEHNHYVQFVNLATSGRIDEAAKIFRDRIWKLRRIQDRYFTMIKLRQNGAFPAQVFKAFARIVGLASGHARPPLLPMPEAEITSLMEELREAGLTSAVSRAQMAR